MKVFTSFLIGGIWLAAWLFYPHALYAQCSTPNTVFGDGEQITYSVYYNWGPVWMEAGLVTFNVSLDTFRRKPVWHLKGTGKSFSSYDVLFKVRDYYDSWVDTATFSSKQFKRYIYEGGYTLLNTLDFDPASNKVISNTKSNNNPQRKDTIQTRPCTFDMLSAIYYTRTLDFSSLLAEEKKHLSVLIDDGYYEIYFRPLGREVVESKDGKRYRCIKFAAKMVHGTIFKGDEDVLVWVTDDANKIPVYIEAKIIVGTIKAYLKEAKGLRNPEGARVK